MDNETNQTNETPEVDLDDFSNELFGRAVQEDSDQVEEETPEQEPEGGENEEETVVQDDGNENEQEGQEEQEQPKKKTVQDRIDELVRQREDAKREGQVQLDNLRREFEEKLAKLTPATQEPPKTEAKAEPTPDDLNEDGTPKYDLGEFDPKYIRDLTRFTMEQERERVKQQLAEESTNQEQRKAQEELATKWNAKVEAATSEYPDFMEKGQELLSKFNGLDESYGQYLSTLLMSMDKGPEVLYYLSTHQEEATAIVNSGAQKATLALGRIEAQFLKPAEQEQPKTVVKQTKAPPPPPAQARARGSNGAFISVEPDTDDLDAFTKEFFAKRR